MSLFSTATRNGTLPLSVDAAKERRQQALLAAVFALLRHHPDYEAARLVLELEEAYEVDAEKVVEKFGL